MAQSMNRGRFVVGDYVVGRQVGWGSFSTVWHARHRVHGTEVAIKEISTGRLDKKLQESLKSEIVILKQIKHPNIIGLHDMIEEPDKIYIVLEYCKGGDLSMYIQKRQGRISEALAIYFMQQLAAGLKVLRDNNLIHRDLKPQNLLLSTNDHNCILKIADFGFARSLDPLDLAETLCGSPLYMAPEIMQHQKYDSKADLWSVGAILFQLVTGKTPFTGNSQTQLLDNIMKSRELQFPADVKDLSTDCIDLCRKLLRRYPVERLTFEEFFNHPFLSRKQPDEFSRETRRRPPPPRVVDGFPLPETNSLRNAVESNQEDLPFSLDYDSSGPDASPSFAKRSPQRTYGFSPKGDRNEVSNTSNNVDLILKYSSGRQKPENTVTRGSCGPAEGKLKESLKSMEHRPVNASSSVVDSLELIGQDYVFVSGPPMDMSSSTSAPKLSNSPPKSSASPPLATGTMSSTSSAPMPIIGSLESQSSGPSGNSQGSFDTGDISEQSSTDCMMRIKSLQRSASAITELVNERIEARKHLEAFSVQLVILAIWKQALNICHTQAMSAIEGSPVQEITRERFDTSNSLDPHVICSQIEIERKFLAEVGNAEELAKVIEPGTTEMPDAMEIIFQCALALGRHGAVDEYMGATETAAAVYLKAARLLEFLLVEAPSLILNPPFSLTNSDRYRLRTYIDLLNNRHSISMSQRMALLKGDQECQP